MKKLAKALTALVLIMAIMVPVFASAEGIAYDRYVKTTGHQRLNMRYNLNYNDPDSVITTIPYGAHVNVLEFLKEGRWAMVEYGGRVGYVVTKCLTKTNPIVKK